MKNYPVSKIILALSLFIFLSILPNSVWAQEDIVDESKEEESTLILFIEEGCPYCSKVEGFIKDKELEEKVEILDVRADPANAAIYTQMSESAGIPLEDQGGVPLLFDNGMPVQSADQILEYIAEKFGVSTEGYEFNGNTTESSKSNIILIIILGAGVLGSVGVLIFTKNR